MHHLLPTVDHSKLHLIRPVFLQTCEEFGIDLYVQQHRETNVTSSKKAATGTSHSSSSSGRGKKTVKPTDSSDFQPSTEEIPIGYSFAHRNGPVLSGWVAMLTQAFRTTPSETNFPFSLNKKHA